jgi:5-methylcytosine-specific restriction enzyme subunit McrC
MNLTQKIPIENIYYLLCYAWNKLEERDIVEVQKVDSTSLLDLFAKVLINGLNHLFKRGLDRGYINFSEDTRCLKGKLCFSQTLKRNLLIKAQVHCQHDEMSYNILHNQIIKSTLSSLIHFETLDITLKKELIYLYRKLHGIDDFKLTRQVFSRVQLNNNNSFYDFLLKICEIIYENLLISEDPGQSKFKDFFQDESKMAYLFEEFVRNFYKKEAKDCKVGREDILWHAKPLNEHSAGYLPKMTTDISIESENAKTVIDTKYYKETLSKHYDQEKIHSAHLFQLYAYLKNMEVKGGINSNCSGVLLYPTLDRDISLAYAMDNHKIVVRTINLNQHWIMIHKDLIDILEDAIQN